MKRNNEKIPEFDDIIFENRNRNYGAYLLRKNYKSTASISVIICVSITVLLVLALAVNSPEGKASTESVISVLVKPEQYIPVPVDPVETKAPAELVKAIRNLQPVIIDDTTLHFNEMLTDAEANTIPDTRVNDSILVYKTTSDQVVDDSETNIPVVVQEMPVFPGGDAALLKFIADNLKYPQEAIDNNIQGRVSIRFVVKSDGSVGRIEVIRGVDSLLDNEATKVVAKLPKFKPGRQNGVAVPVWFSIPVLFRISH